MDDLNEEQILKYITDEIENDKEYINWMKQNNIKDDLDRKKCHLEKSINARQGLLNLYNKEKEKNIPLRIDEKSINEYADELEDLLKNNDGYPIYFAIKERQSIRILSHYVRHSIPKSEIGGNYISKDKIRKKAEEYKNMLDNLNKKTDIDRIKAINERIIVLQEILLGE